MHRQAAMVTVAVAVAVAVAAAAGCGKQPAPGTITISSEPSTGETIIDGMTGRGAVRAYRKAEGKIEQINTEREKDMKDAFGEQQ